MRDHDDDAMTAEDNLAASPSSPGRGPLAWFARNSVAANIVMVALLAGGFLKLRSIKQEVFPEFDLDLVIVNVPYPGASPQEVDQGVIRVAEQAISDVDGIKEVRATAAEGVGVLAVELLLAANPQQALDDVKAAVDRITTFPADTEPPIVFRVSNRFQVISLVFYGDVGEEALRVLAERAKDELVQKKDITVVELAGTREREISIEIPQRKLLESGLTLDQIAGMIRAASVEIPAGGVKTAKGEVLVKTDERRDRGPGFEKIVVINNPQGSSVTVGDLGVVKDGFAEDEIRATYNGKRAVMVNVFRVGEQTPLDLSKTVKDYAAEVRDTLPPGVEVDTWFDTSEIYRQRVDLLLRNAVYGLILVILILGLFLEVRLAFWVTLGIPISFVGTVLFLPSTGVSINMISLFAFIVVLGMVVDDAIIVGEAIYKLRQQGMSRLNAAIQGVREVAAPVTFAIVTTIIAYMPMLFVPGVPGKFFRVIPIVVIIVLTISLVESLFILPAHLAHSKAASHGGLFGWLHRQQQRFSRGFEYFVDHYYAWLVRAAVHRRYLTLSICLAILVASLGLVAGGRINTSFLPKVEGDIVTVKAELPFGSSFDRTEAAQREILRAAQEIIADNGGEAISRGIFAEIGSASMAGFGDPAANAARASSISHITTVSVYLVAADHRPITASRFARQWRQRIGEIPGIERLTFIFETGPQAGAAVHVELRHPDMKVLRAASRDLAGELEKFAGVYDIDDGFAEGKEQLSLRLKPAAESLGISAIELSRQVRASFFGAEATRQQRGRDEVRTYVRLPRSERESEYNIEELVLRTPAGGDIPLRDAATVSRGRSYTSIKRINQRQAVAVTASVDQGVGNAAKIMARMTSEMLPRLLRDYPGMTYAVGGEEKEREEVFSSLLMGFVFAVLAMFALLAIAFRSYVQPVLILLAIPFGIVGAIWGHLIMGYDLSLMSMMGTVALAGVVVNDSLILIVSANRYRDEGMNPLQAVIAGGVRRFRPILMTSLTTFFGLGPMILETSVQAKFLIPMAVSLGFGVMFATFVTLLLIPAAYGIVEDAIRGAVWVKRGVVRLWQYPTAPPSGGGTSADGRDSGETSLR